MREVMNVGVQPEKSSEEVDASCHLSGTSPFLVDRAVSEDGRDDLGVRIGERDIRIRMEQGIERSFRRVCHPMRLSDKQQSKYGRGGERKIEPGAVRGPHSGQ